MMRGDDFKPPLVVAELARQLVKPFVRLRAAVAEEHPARRDKLAELLRQPALRLVIIEVRDVDEPARLGRKGVGDFGVRMTKRADRDTAAEIKVRLPFTSQSWLPWPWLKASSNRP